MFRFILLILFYSTLCFSQTDDKLIALRLKTILIEEYAKAKDLGFMEKIVLELGRSAYEDSLEIWYLHHNNINQVPIKLHYQFRKLIKKVKDNENDFIALELENELKTLTFLGYRNIDYYFQAVKHSEISKLDFSIDELDSVLACEEWQTLKESLYNEERVIKENIRKIISTDKLKIKLSFYIFMFDYLNKIREKIISHDLSRLRKI